jgi:hypothetical protein
MPLKLALFAGTQTLDRPNLPTIPPQNYPFAPFCEISSYRSPKIINSAQNKQQRQFTPSIQPLMFKKTPSQYKSIGCKEDFTYF